MACDGERPEPLLLVRVEKPESPYVTASYVQNWSLKADSKILVVVFFSSQMYHDNFYNFWLMHFNQVTQVCVAHSDGSI